MTISSTLEEVMMLSMGVIHLQKEIMEVLIQQFSQVHQVIIRFLVQQTLLLVMPTTFKINVIIHLMD